MTCALKLWRQNPEPKRDNILLTIVIRFRQDPFQKIELLLREDIENELLDYYSNEQITNREAHTYHTSQIHLDIVTLQIRYPHGDARPRIVTIL